MATQVGDSPSVEEEEEEEEKKNISSTANGVKEVPPSDPSRKLRILCMHGFRTSGSILAQQVALANWAPLIGDIAELVFIDAPWPAQGPSDVERKFAGPYFEWYQSNEDYTEISGLDEAASYFSDYLSLHGPFDGLLGFSQGGVLAAAWMGLSEKGLGPSIPHISFLIVVGGGKGRAKSFQPAYADTISCPSLHFLGDKDFMRVYGEPLLLSFKDPVVLRHPFGHFLPRLGATEGQVFRDFLLQQLQSKIAS